MNSRSGWWGCRSGTCQYLHKRFLQIYFKLCAFSRRLWMYIQDTREWRNLHFCDCHRCFTLWQPGSLPTVRPYISNKSPLPVWRDNHFANQCGQHCFRQLLPHYRQFLYCFFATVICADNSSKCFAVPAFSNSYYSRLNFPFANSSYMRIYWCLYLFSSDTTTQKNCPESALII